MNNGADLYPTQNRISKKESPSERRKAIRASILQVALHDQSNTVYKQDISTR